MGNAAEKVANAPEAQVPRALQYNTPYSAPGPSPFLWASITCCGVWLLWVLAWEITGIRRYISRDLYQVISIALPLVAFVLAMITRRSRARRHVPWLLKLALVLSLGEVALYVLLLPVAQVGPPIRVQCMTHLREVGQAILRYSNNSHGNFPPDFPTLLLNEQNADPNSLICPATSDTPATGPTTQAVVQSFNSSPIHCSYIYTGRGLTIQTITPAHVIAFDKSTNHKRGEISVLYGDFSVKILSSSDAACLLAELNSGHNPPRPRQGG